MKDIRCLLGRHRFSEWVEVGNHLERACLRCGCVEAKYPDPIVMLATVAADLFWKYYVWHKAPKFFVPPKGVYKPSDNR